MSIDVVASSIPAANSSPLVPVGSFVNGTIDFGGDQDWYRVSLVLGQQYSFSLLALDSALGTLDDPVLRLLNGAGTQVAFDDDSGNGLESRIVFTATATGTYFLSAQGYSTDSGTFRLTATNLGGTDVPGNTGTTLTIGAGHNGNGARVSVIGSAGDQDWYSIQLVAGNQYRFELLGIDTGNGTLNDPYLRLLNSAGVQIAADDDSGVGLESQIMFTATASGTYFLSAQGLGSDTGTFRLESTNLGAVAADTVAGNTTTGQTIAANGGVLAGTINTAGDQDWYRVTLTANTQYRFDLGGFDSDGGTLVDPVLRLMNSAGVQIDYNDDAGYTLDSSISFTAQASGTYYLSAQGFGSGTGSFTLTATNLGVIPSDSIAGSLPGAQSSPVVSVGGFVNDTIDHGGDQDWFRVNLVAGREYRFDLNGFVSGAGTLGDPLLTLRDSAGVILETNDDSAFSLDSSISFTAPGVADTISTYYLSAQAFGSSTGSYSLGVTDVTDAVPDVPAGNGSTATVATPAVFATTFVNGTIGESFDEDWYRVSLVAGHEYVFDLKAFDSGFGTLDDPYLVLLNGTGAELDFDDDSGEGLESTITFTAAQSGTYFLAAQGFGYDTGTFRLSVTDNGGPVDSVGQGTGIVSPPRGSVSIGQSVTGLRETGNDQDWFQVSLVQGQTYRFELLGVDSHQGTLNDPYLRLLNSAGTQLAFNDDGGIGLESVITYTAGYTGIHYLSAEGFSTDVGTYRLNAINVSNPVDVPATVNTANSLQINSFATGNIGFSGDLDWYRITLEAGHMYEIDLRGAASGGGTLTDPFLEIYNSLGEWQIGDDDSGAFPPDSSLQITAYDAGTYYLSAESYETSPGVGGTGTYTLQLNEIDVFGNTNTFATVDDGVPITGTIGDHGTGVGDQDWYILALNTADAIPTHQYLLSGFTYRLDVRGLDSGQGTLSDPFLTLYGQDNYFGGGPVFIESSDDSGGTRDSSITFVADGVLDLGNFDNYFVAVEGFGSATGTFQLSLTQVNGEVFFGDEGPDAHFGTPFNDEIYGFEGADVLDGKEGDDYIDGDIGNDTLAGGIGNDTVYGWDGNDLFVQANQESLGDDVLYGEDGNDEFHDHFGHNLLFGGAGDDLFSVRVADDGTNLVNGGEGQDTYRPLGNAAGADSFSYVVMDFAAGAGGDLLDLSALIEVSTDDGFYVQGAPVSSFVRLFQSGADTLVQWDRDGTAGAYGWVTQLTLKNVETNKVVSDNFVGGVDIGTKDDDSLVGGLGNDNVVGVGGNDTLNGGAGEDTLQGGSGNDTYYVDNAKDVVIETSNTPEATSLVFLPGMLEPLVVSSNGVEGIIDAVIAAVNYSLANAPNVENMTLTGAATQGTGNTLNNILLGNGANNRLAGAAGNDTLNGASGNDTLTGGGGNDVYIVNAAGDVVVETAGQGNDLVQSSAGTYVLPANVERMVLTGTGNINGTGNGINNAITGNAGNNILNGAGGNDTMIGGAGSDTYVINTLADVVTELAGQGNDLVQSTITYTIGANIERLTLIGTANVNANGNGANNILNGNAGNNVLNGGGGVDQLKGQGGNDTLIWNAQDTLFDGGAGTDTLKVNGGNLNLTTIASSRFLNMEQINLAGGGNNLLTLNTQDVLDFSTTTNTMKVLGDAGDSINIVPGFTFQGSSGGFNRYTFGGATLLVDVDITNVA